VNWASKVQQTVTDYSSLMRPISLLALFLIAYMFVLRPVQKHALSPSAGPTAAQQALAANMTQSLGPGTSTVEEDHARAALLKEQAIELIRQKPVDTARAMQAWMREEV
jgi:flagellar biosynthesis/type III secretory pathway M-ring protein FliF/YscJ